MKKLFSFLLTTIMVLSLSTAALAAESTSQYRDQQTVTVTKIYKLIGNGSSPAETFTLTQIGNGSVIDGEAESAPALGTITGAIFTEGAATAEGTEGKITIALPTYTSVGIYEYTLKETAGTTAGVTYYGENIKLFVTVINDEEGNIRVAAVHTENENSDEKSDRYENTYSAGTLKLSKTVTGNLGDKDKYFAFTITLIGESDKDYADSFPLSGGSHSNLPDRISLGETTLYLKHGDTVSIGNIPYGVSYTITEATLDDYTTIKTGDTGTINAAEQQSSFTNTKEAEIDTGISLDNLPYILLFAFAGLGLVVFFIRKRIVSKNN